MKKESKDALLVTALIAGISVSGFLGYREVFLDGVEDLPERVCDATVDNSIAARVLPDTRKVTVQTSQGRPGDDIIFSCSLTTEEESILFARAEMMKSSQESWRNYHADNKDGKPIDLAGGIEATSWPRDATIYIPCTPPYPEGGAGSQPYALTVTAGMFSESRASGDELRQAIVDIGFQVAERAYEVAECKEETDFPPRPPRTVASR
ncbi:hypothetical protein ACLIYM_18555 [Streptomyces fenghuangensis]|uniref:Uncharacterized protein n=1 Tax=Streptomyces chitinivorans TaxID=1257027 RepID=A0ABW7I015_9ACTN|nr:hypothetical protein [Streptomyces chitinivorans]MDH2407644.1 hypothetical protein [Streptomyces chitinivorans]